MDIPLQRGRQESTVLIRPQVSDWIHLVSLRREGQPTGGSYGPYRATFVLIPPGRAHFADALDFRESEQWGDSVLRAAPGTAAEFTLNAHAGTALHVRVVSNVARRLARAEIGLTAENLDDAERVTYAAVMGLLSWIAFQHDAPLDVGPWKIVEERTGEERWRVGILARERSFTFDPVMVKQEYVGALAAYREGLGSTSPFHRVLSFYRVIEGVEHVRAARQRRRTGAVATLGNERIPPEVEGADPWSQKLRLAMQPYRGQTFRSVRNQLRSAARNALAHLNPFERSLVVDRYEDVAAAEHASLVLRYVARIMLANELALE